MQLGGGLPGDQWEPAIAADRYGHVYALIPDFPPSCKGCPKALELLVAPLSHGSKHST
jgi:hypothetical protein